VLVYNPLLEELLTYKQSGGCVGQSLSKDAGRIFPSAESGEGGREEAAWRMDRQIPRLLPLLPAAVDLRKGGFRRTASGMRVRRRGDASLLLALATRAEGLYCNFAK
jgi:hypothetical protein